MNFSHFPHKGGASIPAEITYCIQCYLLLRVVWSSKSSQRTVTNNLRYSTKCSSQGALDAPIMVERGTKNILPFMSASNSHCGNIKGPKTKMISVQLSYVSIFTTVARGLKVQGCENRV